MRSLVYSKAFPKRTNDDGSPVCRWWHCDKVLAGKRQSFCGQACTDKALILCWPTEQRRQTLARDKGICAECGLDCIAAYQYMKQHEGYIVWVSQNGYEWKRRGVEAAAEFLGIKMGNKQTFWEANHKIAVIEGGTSSLDNLETLCLLCHRAHTKDLAARRASARKRPLTTNPPPL